jgi:hypothetical protein
MKTEGTPTITHQFTVTSAPGAVNGPQPTISPAIVPFNPQVWGLLPQAQNLSLAVPQRLAPPRLSCSIGHAFEDAPAVQLVEFVARIITHLIA